MPLDFQTLISFVKHAIAAWIWAKRQLDGKAAYAIPRIEKYINSRSPRHDLVKLYRITSEAPEVRVERDVLLDQRTSELACANRAQFSLNERHALAIRWDGSGEARAIGAESCDFAALEAMRKIAKEQNLPPPQPISANALIVCASERKLILHQRSPDSTTYGDKLHTFGGAFKPSQYMAPFDIPGDRNSLEFTMIREVFEEAGIIVRRYAEPICVAQEVNTGFIQYVFLGVRITKSQYAHLEENPEGKVMFLSFDKLPQKLHAAEGWVDSGRAHILLWLGLGAPGAGIFPRFAGLTPRALFDQVVGPT